MDRNIVEDLLIATGDGRTHRARLSEVLGSAAIGANLNAIRYAQST